MSAHPWPTLGVLAPAQDRAYQGARALDRAYGVWAHLVDGAALSSPADVLAQVAAAFVWYETPAAELEQRTLAALGIWTDNGLDYHGFQPTDDADRAALTRAWRALIAQRTPVGWWR